MKYYEFITNNMKNYELYFIVKVSFLKISFHTYNSLKTYSRKSLFLHFYKLLDF
jgi:hypothetical protein